MSISAISYEKMFQLTDSFFKAQFDEERNIVRLSQLLASNFQIVSTGIAFTAGLDEYLKIMEEKHYDNVIGKVNYISPLQHFPGAEPETIRWKIKVLQHRLGKGLNENGEGKYKIKAECIFHFIKENNEWKIHHLLQTDYSKEKILSSCS